MYRDECNCSTYILTNIISKLMSVLNIFFFHCHVNAVLNNNNNKRNSIICVNIIHDSLL